MRCSETHSVFRVNRAVCLSHLRASKVPRSVLKARADKCVRFFQWLTLLELFDHRALFPQIFCHQLPPLSDPSFEIGSLFFDWLPEIAYRRRRLGELSIGNLTPPYLGTAGRRQPRCM